MQNTLSPIDNIQKLIKEKGMEFRSFSGLEFREVSSTDGQQQQLIIEGRACPFNSATVLFESDGIDYKEKIDSRAFESADITDVIFNYNHCGRVYARTRNQSLQLSIDNDGLKMRAILMSDDEGHRQLYRDIKAGLIDRMSYAYTIEESSYDSTLHMRTILKIKKVFDVSAVDIPAYNETNISVRSFFMTERDKELKEIEERQKQLELAKAKFFFYA